MTQHPQPGADTPPRLVAARCLCELLLMSAVYQQRPEQHRQMETTTSARGEEEQGRCQILRCWFIYLSL
ncbi:hypothetical protein PBY51_004732 [Eleginops maclovinus]|uniref:Uncharacterized protein n=1 Tax=Eleginops maclovinus TaxID=56733 RepID=A0AAN8A996_ELEMC|nr:hypothetical protein PBY51_004732 [Eleginops maclovinus]